MPELWMPGAIRIESDRRNPLNRNGFRLITWHTFEAGYSLTVENALKLLIRNGSEAFVFHPVTGQWGQCQPMDTGARTLKAPGGFATNRFGSVHQQVEVIGYARQPWTSDLTPEGKAGLAKGIEFFRSWGIPDQWAFDQPPPAYPGPGVKRAYPSRSGHAYHSGWIGNDHGDPGAMAAPWTLVPSAAPDPAIVRLQQDLVSAGLLTPADVDGIDGPTTQTAKEAAMSMLDDLRKEISDQIDRARRDILAALTVPLNEEGGRVFGTGRDTITVGQAVGGLGLAARRSEVVLALAHPDETEAMRKWASDGGPKPGLRKDGE